jgi:hypothetical protein
MQQDVKDSFKFLKKNGPGTGFSVILGHFSKEGKFAEGV